MTYAGFHVLSKDRYATSSAVLSKLHRQLSSVCCCDNAGMHHQTFTGTSRRQRQVNLSGRTTTNPFASSSSKAGPQSAVASAQRDREDRQLQRKRLQASAHIQRVWRGHTSRRKTFQTWREIWDELEEEDSRSHGAYTTADDSLRQLNRLLLFYNPRVDVKRVTWYGMRQMATSDTVTCRGTAWQRAYLRLVRACILAFRKREQVDKEVDRALLTTLAFAARRTHIGRQDAIQYYEVLTSLKDVPVELLQSTFISPLQNSPDSYGGLAVLLSRPLDPDMLALLRSSVDSVALTKALTHLKEFKPGSRPQSRLWLLGNTIYLSGTARNEAFINVTARLLGSLADDVEFESASIDLDNAAFDQDVLSKVTPGLPLNKFLHDQVSSLLDQDSIRNLLVQTNQGASDVSANTQLMAGYALTLLRCFPRRADDI